MKISEMQTVLANPVKRAVWLTPLEDSFFLKDHGEHTNNMGVHKIIESQPEDGHVRGWWVRVGLRTWVLGLV